MKFLDHLISQIIVVLKKVMVLLQIIEPTELELLTAIFDKTFNNFERKVHANFINPLSMIEYSKRLKKISYTNT